MEIRKRGGQWTAVFELSADECEVMAHWIPRTDGARSEYEHAAREIRAREDDEAHEGRPGIRVGWSPSGPTLTLTPGGRR